ncbi:protoporphyrinogen oxidase HemJ [Moraxella nasicaprae]|uniref:Protoporphyrinogen IX oxidase n=1 Tax=Moraxella nasicaprae TaxID=2904122 RepID=A0ABY6F5S1_9GAMM|nr:protoporphyrinogen oxidase HemJ [Moraxella nasicaprae]UXZ05451.1 protoporphyrinogen oxidase HemJ [Moraxella nasicaprae]
MTHLFLNFNIMFDYIKAFHIIAMVCWFAGIFYLPRLFVYHAMSDDKISQDRFALMERKLYRGIMNPAMMATWALGLSMVISHWEVYKTQGWLHAKLLLVILLTIYHIACGRYRLKLMTNPTLKTHTFWRWFNEIPVFILIAVVVLVITKPF